MNIRKCIRAPSYPVIIIIGGESNKGTILKVWAHRRKNHEGQCSSLGLVTAGLPVPCGEWEDLKIDCSWR